MQFARALSGVASILALGVVVSAMMVTSAGPTQAQSIAPPRCDAMVARYGASGLWRAYYGGRYLANPFQDWYRWIGYEGCFRSRKACEAWLYDVQTFAPDVTHIERCHRLR